MAIFITFRYES